MEWWNAVLPVVTLILGYLGTLITEAAQGDRARRIVNDERTDALSATRLAERRAFELQTLTELREALRDLARAAGRAHHFDQTKARESGSKIVPTTQLPEEINDALFESNRQVQSLVGLVMDAEARARVDAFTSAVARMGFEKTTLEEASSRLLSATEIVDESQRLLAERIRGIYEGTVTTS